MMSRIRRVILLLLISEATCLASDWPLWDSYVAKFVDDQARVIDHDVGDRTTSEGQAYGMFFSLVANDRSRFDKLLRWTESNLAAGDLSSHLPAWLWGRAGDNQWKILDSNSAADADLWMAYTLIAAGHAWSNSHYEELGKAIAARIATEEVVRTPGFGPVLLPAPKGFVKGNTFRLNASYLPLQLLLCLDEEMPGGPWGEIASRLPKLLKGSVSNGFVMDWVEFTPRKGSKPYSADKNGAVGSYDAIRVYLWAGMLDPGTKSRQPILKTISGMSHYLQEGDSVPPAKVSAEGKTVDAKGPPGFSAALVPYMSAIKDEDKERSQISRLQSQLDPNTGLYGNPSKYYDQNLAMFANGWLDRRFWFNSGGKLELGWGTGRSVVPARRTFHDKEIH